MSGFSSLNTAITGLTAAQRAMDVAGQNIVNANTPGYARQRVQLGEVASATSASFFTGSGEAVGGVSVQGVERLKDAFVEGARAAAGARQAALTSQTGALTGAQQLLAERALHFVRGYIGALTPRAAAYDRRGIATADVQISTSSRTA